MSKPAVKQETIEAGLKIRAVKPHQLKRVNVDTTVYRRRRYGFLPMRGCMTGRGGDW
jgi:hypothetical protein